MSPSLLLPFFFIFGTALLNTVYCDFVPVYLWEKSNTAELEPTLSRVSKDTFKEVINSRIDKKTLIVVFAEKNLSPEDFVINVETGKNVFPHIIKLKETNKITYLPFVEDPISVIKEQTDKEIIEVSINNLLKTNSLPKGEILIIDLNDAKDNENRIEMLNRHDSSIMSIYDSLLKTNDKVVAMYTGHAASWVTSEEIRNHRQARHILDEPPKPKSVFTTNNLIISFGKDPVFVKDTSSSPPSNSTIAIKTVTDTYDNGTLNVVITGDKETINMTFEFGDGGYWVLTSVTMDKLTFRVKGIAAPELFSYHCSSQVFYSIEEDDVPLASLSFPELQVQPFKNRNTTMFGDAYDCVGFTTVPIWSGLFVTFILAIIMTLGLTMIMDIKTMDRFDDPKGKTIIINASE